MEEDSSMIIPVNADLPISLPLSGPSLDLQILHLKCLYDANDLLIGESRAVPMEKRVRRWQLVGQAFCSRFAKADKGSCRQEAATQADIWWHH